MSNKKNYIITYLIFSFAPVMKRMTWQIQDLFQANLKEFLEWLTMQFLFFLFIMGLLWLLFFVCGKFSKRISVIISSPIISFLFMFLVLSMHTIFFTLIQFYCTGEVTDVDNPGERIFLRECVKMKSFNIYELLTILIVPTILVSNFDKILPIKAIKRHFQKYLQG